MKMLTLSAAAWVVAFTTLAAGQAAPAAGQGTAASQGVYTAAQADRGAATFKQSCTACHDTARFTGPDFLGAWSGKSLHGLFDHIHTTMPEDNPGSLKPQQYADIVAYMLKLNGYPAGKEELKPGDALKPIAFDKPKK